ncbi:MAG: endonuclease/exonuclease/phosphatase family protein [Nocardioides sp.]
MASARLARRAAVVMLPTALLLALVAGLLSIAAGDADAGSSAASSARRAAPEPREMTKLRVVDHNIQRRSDALNRAIGKARSTRAQIITLQEVCWWQLKQLRARHPRWSFAWQVDRDAPWCERVDRSNPVNPQTRSAQGNVVISTGGHGKARARYFDDQLNRGRRQGMACLTWQNAGVVRHACSLHLISGGDQRRDQLRTRQAREVYRTTHRWIRHGDLVVLGGDFNASPHRPALDYLYRYRGRGGFREATPRHVGGNRDCRCSSTTFDGGRTKIDYIFFSANRMAARAARQLLVYPTGSDHHLLVGWALIDTRPLPRS